MFDTKGPLKFPYKNNKEFSKEHIELVWFGIGLGVMATQKTLSLSNQEVRELPAIINSAMSKSAVGMVLLPEMKKELQDHPSELWTDVFENIMHAIKAEIVGILDATWATVFSGTQPKFRDKVEEEAYNKLMVVKDMMTVKGFVKMDSMEDLTNALVSLDRDTIEKLKALLDPKATKSGAGVTSTNSDDSGFFH